MVAIVIGLECKQKKFAADKAVRRNMKSVQKSSPKFLKNVSPLVSIIVPIYNTGRYLYRCVESILLQDEYSTIETILVDDGSTDGSNLIAEQIALEHQEIVFIRQKNRGLGGARNAGARLARGKYLFFLDSDDYIGCVNAISVLYSRAMVSDADIVWCSKNETAELNQAQKRLDPITQFHEEVIDGKSLIRQIDFTNAVWRGLFKKVFLVENSLRFREKVFYEDADWTLRAFYGAKRVSVVSFSVYVYCYRSDSITNTKGVKALRDNARSLIATKRYSRSAIAESDIVEIIDKRIVRSIASLLRLACEHKFSEVIGFVRHIRRAGLLNLAVRYGTVKLKFSAFVLELVPAVGCFFISYVLRPVCLAYRAVRLQIKRLQLEFD
jgi:glycosyltransferase involved in cell wall biosynthesis